MRAAQDIPAQSLPRVTYAPRGDTSQEAEITTLRNIYSLILGCANKSARDVTSSEGEDARKDQDASTHLHST
jgi:hypothetical protein